MSFSFFCYHVYMYHHTSVVMHTHGCSVKVGQLVKVAVGKGGSVWSDTRRMLNPDSHYTDCLSEMN